MKANLFNSILCASLLVFAVGCGKNKSGGGSNVLPYYGNNLTSQQAVTNLNSWYNGTTEGSKLLGILEVKKYQSSSNNGQNCDELDLGIISIPYCTFSYSSNNNNLGSQVGSTVDMTVSNISQVAIKNSGNAELNAIFSNPSAIVQATQVGTRAYRLDTLQNNQLVSYIIDMSYHSKLNPVVKITQGQSSVTTLTTVANCKFPGTPSCTYSNF